MNLVRGNSFIMFAILAVAVVMGFPMPGIAQQLVRDEFNLPQEVRWGNSVLPMGDYVYFVDSSGWPALVRVEQKSGGFSQVFVPEGLLRPGTPGGSALTIGDAGGGAYVMSLRLQATGGELYFPAPSGEPEKSSGDQPSSQESGQSSVRPLSSLTILNPNHEKVSLEEAEKVYLRVCEAIEKEFNRATPIRPRLVVRLGAPDNVLRYPMGEILLKKWDEYRFADGVLDVAMHELLPPEARTRLSNTAVKAAGSTVSVCELKACVN